MFFLGLVALCSASLHVSLHRSSISTPRLHGRETSTALQQANYYYWMELGVGTPSQPVQVFIDTGSSDLWVPTAQTCNTDPQGNLMYGMLEINCNYTFDPQSSNSLSRNQTADEFSISYLSGKYAEGFYAQDSVNIGDSRVDSINLAVATNATGSPVLGIGYPYGESCVIWTPGPLRVSEDSCIPYNNFPMQLKLQGVISTVSYSMWLNDVNKGAGSILFGGVDHTKYIESNLTTVPMEKEIFHIDPDSGDIIEYPEYTRTIVALSSIKLKSPQGVAETIMEGGIPALLDSGTPTCMVPSSIVAAFYKVFGIYRGSTRAQSIHCSVPENWFITFNFRGYEIDVPMSQFIRPLLYEGDETFDNRGNMLCSPGFETNDGQNYVIIGHNVMTSLYTVFDLENNEVGLGAAFFNGQDCSSQVESIVDTIPSATNAPSYSEGVTLGISVATSPSAQLLFSPIQSITTIATGIRSCIATPASETAQTSNKPWSTSWSTSWAQSSSTESALNTFSSTANETLEMIQSSFTSSWFSESTSVVGTSIGTLPTATDGSVSVVDHPGIGPPTDPEPPTSSLVEVSGTQVKEPPENGTPESHKATLCFAIYMVQLLEITIW